MTQATTQGEEELQQNDPLWVELWTMVDSTGFPSVEVDFERLFDFIKERDNIHEVELTKARLEDLEKMNKHYSLKGGSLLLYEENGKNVYLGDRIDALTTQLKKGE